MIDRRPSMQTRQVLQALQSTTGIWRHGYDLARETSLAPGTLYPILGRLTDRGLLESRWEEDPPAGRPRRHLYRLSSAGLEHAEQHVADTTESFDQPQPLRASSRLANGFA